LGCVGNILIQIFSLCLQVELDLRVFIRILNLNILLKNKNNHVMKLFIYLLTALILIVVYVYCIIFNGYEPVPTDFLVFAVLHLILADSSKKNKD
jgi:hypothetical protein